ncbi:hypothetical protein NPIL_543131 [Nephila pilipes]|uniref:Uncharacterized protein n=1 Tax=Nephila pilipes TaxID=299642 RepID=A0A8X6U9K0_NEPPI|nr:hypothetical protein NPIL_543131 [Nephila pilipes]
MAEANPDGNYVNDVPDVIEIDVTKWKESRKQRMEDRMEDRLEIDDQMKKLAELRNRLVSLKKAFIEEGKVQKRVMKKIEMKKRP